MGVTYEDLGELMSVRNIPHTVAVHVDLPRRVRKTKV